VSPAGRAEARPPWPLAMRALAVLLLPVALAACGKPDNAPGPGGVSVGEARALDEAAAMIADQPPPKIGTATTASGR